MHGTRVVAENKRLSDRVKELEAKNKELEGQIRSAELENARLRGESEGYKDSLDLTLCRFKNLE